MVDRSRRNVDLELIKDSLAVPNKFTARCMYYAACVMNIVKFNNQIFDKYTDYTTYHQMNANDYKKILEFCENFSPSTLIGFDLLKKVSTLPGMYLNKFFDADGNNVNRTLLIKNHYVTVIGSMHCTKDWLDNYYFTPVRGLKSEIQSLPTSQGNSDVTRTMTNMTNNAVNASQTPPKNEPVVEDKKKLNFLKNPKVVCIVICLVVVFLVIFLPSFFSGKN